MSDLVGRRVVLRPLRLADRDWLYELAVDPAAATWRLGGATPDPDRALAFLSSAVACQYLIEAKGDGSPLGLVQILNVDALSRHGEITLVLDPAHRGVGWPLEAVVLAVDHAFSALRLRQLYIKADPGAFAHYASILANWAPTEVVQADAVRGEGDAVIATIRRSDWDHDRTVGALRAGQRAAAEATR